MYMLFILPKILLDAGLSWFIPGLKSLRELVVIIAALAFLHSLAFCPAHRGEKSPEPMLSALARSGAIPGVANGNSGGNSDRAPSSRITRFTMPRAGLPLNRLVNAVWRAASLCNAFL